MNETIYQTYKIVKRLIEKSEACCNKDHSDEPIFKKWKTAIHHFDSTGKGYAERYAKEKENDTVA